MTTTMHHWVRTATGFERVSFSVLMESQVSDREFVYTCRKDLPDTRYVFECAPGRVLQRLQDPETEQLLLQHFERIEHDLSCEKCATHVEWH